MADQPQQTQQIISIRRRLLMMTIIQLFMGHYRSFFLDDEDREAVDQGILMSHDLPMWHTISNLAITLPVASSPVYFRVKGTTGPNGRDFWELYHANLPDDDSANGFKANYRMRLSTFNAIVKGLATHEKFPLTAHNTIHPIIQIAAVLWRFSNLHFGYRMAKIHLGVSHG